MNIPGTDLRFLHPWFLLLIPVVAALGIYLSSRARRSGGAVRFSDLRHARASGRTWRTRLRPMLMALRQVAICLFLVAMARPQMGWRERQIDTYGVDIVLALDISASMQETDFYPNRLDAAKVVLTNFLDKRDQDRIGVVIFGDSAFTLCPLTLDYGVIKDFIGRLAFNRLGDQKTALGLGLATAVKRLKDSKAKSKIVLLLTDGVDTAGQMEPLTAADLAQSLGIKVYAIGVGSERKTMTASDLFFRSRTSSGGGDFDPDTLKKIADKTGGRYFHATDEKKLEDIYDEIAKLETSKVEYTEFDHFNERMEFVFIPALLLLMLEALLANTIFLKLP